MHVNVYSYSNYAFLHVYNIVLGIQRELMHVATFIIFMRVCVRVYIYIYIACVISKYI